MATVKQAILGACVGMALPIMVGGTAVADVVARPAIKHNPVTVVVPGQAISLRATVTAAEAPLKAVSLYYTPSADVAPFKVAMHDAGEGAYIGTIDPALLVGLKNISYYIEAVDAEGATTETAWYAVRIGGETPETAADPAGGRRSWKKPALIGAGVVAAGGAAMALGGGGGGGGGTAVGTNTTLYVGSATVGLQLAGSAVEYQTYPVTISVHDSGSVSSDSIRPGHYVEANLVQNDFLLASPVEEDGLTGEIQFVGTILNDRISGSVRGSVTTTDAKSGFYVGTFSATKQ